MTAFDATIVSNAPIIIWPWAVDRFLVPPRCEPIEITHLVPALRALFLLRFRTGPEALHGCIPLIRRASASCAWRSSSSSSFSTSSGRGLRWRSSLKHLGQTGGRPVASDAVPNTGTPHSEHFIIGRAGPGFLPIAVSLPFSFTESAYTMVLFENSEMLTTIGAYIMLRNILDCRLRLPFLHLIPPLV